MCFVTDHMGNAEFVQEIINLFLVVVEDTKGIIIIRASKKDRQHNGQNKKDRQHNGQNKKDRQHNSQNKKDKWTNNDLQNTTQETKDQETRIPLNT